MPKKGYKAPPKITARDYVSSMNLCNAAIAIVTEVAKKHGDVPEMLAAISLLENGRSLLHERKAQVDQRQVVEGPQGQADVDRPGEAVS
jgi:hypothetical protein